MANPGPALTSSASRCRITSAATAVRLPSRSYRACSSASSGTAPTSERGYARPPTASAAMGSPSLGVLGDGDAPPLDVLGGGREGRDADAEAQHPCSPRQVGRVTRHQLVVDVELDRRAEQ